MNFSIASQAAAILFREGLEAMLVIAALAAFLRKADATDRLAALYGGALAAVAASFAMAWVFVAFFDGVHNDLIEAAVMAIAAVLLLYMSGWLFVRQDPRTWQAEVKAMAGRALGAGTVLSLAAIAFLVVFREGAETVLFLVALAASAGGWGLSIAAGLIAACAGLFVAYLAIEKLALRLPLRPIFLLTSAFLFVIAIRLVGATVQELQEQVIVPVHDDGVPEIVTALGSNGSWEALALQGLIILTALVWAGWSWSRGKADRVSDHSRLSAAE